MKESDIFKQTMKWLGMDLTTSKECSNGDVIVFFTDTGKIDKRFSKEGYDEFYAGMMYDKDGHILIAYLDSHVVNVSEKSDILDEYYKALSV